MRKQIIEQYEWREKFCLSSLSLHQEKGNFSAELISGKPENVSTTHLCHLQLKSFCSSLSWEEETQRSSTFLFAGEILIERFNLCDAYYYPYDCLHLFCALQLWALAVDSVYEASEDKLGWFAKRADRAVHCQLQQSDQSRVQWMQSWDNKLSALQYLITQHQRTDICNL